MDAFFSGRSASGRGGDRRGLGRGRPSGISSCPAGIYRFVALDVETANSDTSSICQIGLACVEDGGGIEVWSTLVDPGQRFSAFNVQIHGIDAAMVRGAPGFPEVLGRIAPLLERHFLIQHSGFDKRAVEQASLAHGLEAPDWTWGDSVRIARRAWPEFRGNGGHGLGHLKQALGLEFDHHDAGEDARAAAMVVLLAEARTGESYRALLAQTGGARAPEAVPCKDVAPHLPRLDELVRFLMGAGIRPPGDGTMAQGTAVGPDRAAENDLGVQLGSVDRECRAFFETGGLPSPHGAWRVAVLLRRARYSAQERAFLAAWCRHFAGGRGRRYGELVARARKLGVEI